MSADNSNNKNLNIAIVGAGISGLATAVSLLLQRAGHRVTVLEKYENCQPVFNGALQLHANATRVLSAYGLAKTVEKYVPTLESVHNLHRLTDGHLLYNLPKAISDKRYKQPIWNIDRSRLLRILLKRAEELGAVCKFGLNVVDVDDNGEMLTIALESGEMLPFDLVVAADGIRSKIRTKILGPIEAKRSLTAYSFTIPLDRFKTDNGLDFLKNKTSIWIGPKQCIFALYLPTGCGISFCDESNEGESGVWNNKVNIEHVKKRFSTTDTRLLEALDSSKDNCFIWHLSDFAELNTWRNKSGRVVLAGDAAHAMLPYSGQGAGCSVEDSACLAACLAGTETIAEATAAYEAIRKPRASFITLSGRRNMEYFHMVSGPAQEARDATLKKIYDEQVKEVSCQAAPAPALEAGPVPRKLEDFAPPQEVTHMNVPATRAYICSYDIFAHTQTYLQSLQ